MRTTASGLLRKLQQTGGLCVQGKPSSIAAGQGASAPAVIKAKTTLLRAPTPVL